MSRVQEPMRQRNHSLWYRAIYARISTEDHGKSISTPMQIRPK
jgi:hypothetical protein